MSNLINSKSVTVTSISTFLLIVLSMGYINGVHAQELNTSDFKYSLHITDIIPFYTYQGVSKVLTGGAESLEDQDVLRLIIQDTDFYAVYTNQYDNTFEFVGIYQGVN